MYLTFLIIVHFQYWSTSKKNSLSKPTLPRNFFYKPLITETYKVTWKDAELIKTFRKHLQIQAHSPRIFIDLPTKFVPSDLQFTNLYIINFVYFLLLYDFCYSIFGYNGNPVEARLCCVFLLSSLDWRCNIPGSFPKGSSSAWCVPRLVFYDYLQVQVVLVYLYTDIVTRKWIYVLISIVLLCWILSICRQFLFSYC